MKLLPHIKVVKVVLMAQQFAISKDVIKEVDLTEKITIEKCVNIFDFDKAIKNRVGYK